jgi:hypothetical protein
MVVRACRLLPTVGRPGYLINSISYSEPVLQEKRQFGKLYPDKVGGS